VKQKHTPLLNLFKHCPQCGDRKIQNQKGSGFKCKKCTLNFYINPGCAVAAVVRDRSGKILFVKRAKNPSKGKLGLPGGFIDPGETAEEALCRELKEELNLEIVSMNYLTSAPNRYCYGGIIYSVLDFFYTARVHSFKPIQALDEVDGYCFLKKSELSMNRIAFPSMRSALKLFLKSN
jgi:NAD+ diphosphatase